jgi:hypothetical protein
MHGATMKNYLQKLLLLITLLSVVSFWGGCADETAESAVVNAPKNAKFDSDYRVEALVTIDDTVRTLTFRAEAQSPTSANELGTKAVTADTVPGIKSATMTELARFALSECGMRHSPAATVATDNYSCVAPQFASAVPWAFSNTLGSAALPNVTNIANKPVCG